jgi:hypothetical protein
MSYAPIVMHLDPREEIWVQSHTANKFEVGVQLNKDQYTYLELDRDQLQQLSTNIHQALLETE